MSRPIFLFDLDGVLVQPAGYRAAVSATVNWVTTRLGLGNLAPEEAVFALCESLGITNEWDMIPIILGSILETLLEANPQLEITSLESPLIKGKFIQSPGGADLFTGFIHRSSEVRRSGISPAESIWLSAQAEDSRGPFPRLAQQSLFNVLFQNTDQVGISPLTTLFQNYVLGSDLFQQVFEMPAQVKTESFLQSYDKPLISALNSATLLRLSAQERLFVAAYTARPSLPPCEVAQNLEHYSPEAEMALKLAGLEVLPLVAYGRLKYIAGQLGISPDVLIKPSPFQAMAGITAAILQAELPALQWAAGFLEYKKGVIDGQINRKLRESAPLEVVIFEDSPIGIQSGQDAVNKLNQAGIPARFKGYGIAQNQVKIRALESVNAQVFATIDEALKSALVDFNISEG